ncbi:MAG TPA: type 4a pilus biogenesis protein PilO [Steroidobacteraceae bacterium]|jgi:hypothetical protein
MKTQPPRRVVTPKASPVVATMPQGRSLQVRVQALRVQIAEVWLPRAVWTVSRSGRAGLVGIGLMGASLVFLISTYLPVRGEIQQLGSDLGVARAHAAAVSKVAVANDSPQTLRNLPKRNEVPDLLAKLLQRADAAQLSIDTAKYEVSAGKAGAIVRYQVAFPVSGPYPRVREFIDSTLSDMPALSLDGLAIQRKSISDPDITAQITMTVFTRGVP